MRWKRGQILGRYSGLPVYLICKSPVYRKDLDMGTRGDCLRPCHPERARSRLVSDAKQGRAWVSTWLGNGKLNFRIWHWLEWQTKKPECTPAHAFTAHPQAHALSAQMWRRAVRMQTCSSHVHTGHVHALYIYDVYTCVSMCMYSASTGIAAYMNVTSDLCTQCGCAYIYMHI